MLGIGALGYRLVEGSSWTLLDGLFMTVITLTTVGFGEVHPLSPQGRIFTIILIVFGAGLMAYTITAGAQFVLEGKLREIWGKRRMKDTIRGMKSHFIICGAGKTGMVVIHELIRRKTPLVVIDSDPKIVSELFEQQIPAIEGDATIDEVLVEAGLENACALVATLPHDADNVFVALTAKGLNQKIFVVSTAAKIESVPKLKRAGANYVVSPNIIAGARLASVLMRPTVVDFLDATMAGQDQELQMEEFHIVRGSYLDGKALKDADVRRRSGAIIVSVRRGEKNVINPEPAYVFEPGDTLVVLGNIDQITKMGDLASHSSNS